METLQTILDAVITSFAGIPVGALFRAALLLVLGIALGRGAGRVLFALLEERLGGHMAQLLRRGVGYAVASLFAVAALHELGFELSVLLGAAGVLTVAVGFAAQTAASNLVSGVFLIAEGPFAIGEAVKINDVTGEVLSIDLLSIKLRTFDNLLVRIPNETVMKAVVTNLGRFPIRRFDLKVFVDAEGDLDELEAVLLGATANPTCLEEPKPIVIFLGFNESGVEVQLSAWALRENFLGMRNQLHKDVASALRESGIAFAYPRRRVAFDANGPPSIRGVDAAS